MNEVTYLNPEFFYLFLLLPLMALYYIIKNRKQKAALKVSTTEGFKKASPSIRRWLRHILPLIRLAVLSLLIIALARPQTTSNSRKIKTEGIDVILTLDISGSMMAEDFKPNRMEAAKNTAAEFIGKRLDDRIGLVVFSGQSFTLCPLTIDHKVLMKYLRTIDTSMISVDGTAIGSGLSTAVNRLKESKAKSKVVILLTDGINNAGSIDPLTAAEMAHSYGIKVYTIGVGTRGYADYKVKTNFGPRTVKMKVEIDEEILKKISGLTNGKYFRATKNKELEKIYDEIDSMEKSEIDLTVLKTHKEEFLPYVLIALGLLLFELLLRYTIFRSLP